MKRHFSVLIALAVLLVFSSVTSAAKYDFNGETVVFASVRNENNYFKNDQSTWPISNRWNKSLTSRSSSNKL